MGPMKKDHEEGPMQQVGVAVNDDPGPAHGARGVDEQCLHHRDRLAGHLALPGHEEGPRIKRVSL